MAVSSVHMIVFSPCGGSACVARVLARDIPCEVHEHSWTLPRDRERKPVFGPEDLVFLVFPVYGGDMPINIKSLFAGLEGRNTPCAPVAVYGNRAFEGALLTLDREARAHGFEPVAAVAAIAQHSMVPALACGRPDETDRANLAGFGVEILALARQGHRLAKAPGRPRDWEIPADLNFFPVTDPDRCTSCGLCAEICPAGAIPQDRPAHTDTGLCIDCYACVKNCPAKARSLGNEKTARLFEPHLREASVRKEAQLFI